MELGLAGRATLVTGAAGGIGRAVAAALAGEGVRLALVDRDADAVADAAALAETDLADWQRVIAVNATGSFLVLKHAIPALRESDTASVVFVSSDSS